MSNPLSHHPPSLDAALAHCGTAVEADALASAITAGDLETCWRLFETEGCEWDGCLVGTAAAHAGSLPVFEWLVHTMPHRELDLGGNLLPAIFYAGHCSKRGESSMLAHVASSYTLAALQQYYEPWGTGLLEGVEPKLRLLLAAAASPTPDWADKCGWLWARGVLPYQLPELLRQQAASPTAAAGPAAAGAGGPLPAEGPAAQQLQQESMELIAAAAAEQGHVPVLRLLRRRGFVFQLGVAIDLVAVAQGGSEEALSWAVAALEAAGQAPKPLSCSELECLLILGNLAAADWLVRHGLAPQKQELLMHMLLKTRDQTRISLLQWVVGMGGEQERVGSQQQVQWTAELHAALVGMQGHWRYAVPAHKRWLAALIDVAAAEAQGGRTSAHAGV
ncbi:hypothetical protein HXX76_012915 [Chlamydomonas incerta]|uniref:Uncharacterized protein n=1 Tax=Chlamydomonas incerta TaxID=51695 RepID=A0A835VV33_CHLIN|nr:hypothetical protein HXX76_012915 [Chlamydomonas incerta]|eukprot:KAG2426599.1 hypothetical protein HXX76_012915 [Chlamydomonas incerta]